MSRPSIPGYAEQPNGKSLIDLWDRPDEPFPDALWPRAVLADVTPSPTGWLTIEQYSFSATKHGGISCVLVKPGDATRSLRETSWIGRYTGQVSVWDDNRFDDGLRITDRDVDVEFFVQARSPSGGPDLPLIELSQPFLWYWDAFPVLNGWNYLNRAGREQELVRWTLAPDTWNIEVRALELRQFLAACDRVAVLQVDVTLKVDEPSFVRVDTEYMDDWSHFSFFAVHDLTIGDNPAFSGVMGQYLIQGMRNSRVPRWEERTQDRDFPEFVYAMDPETGEPKSHSCDPDTLGTYFDKDDSRLHYLTPVYFKREVLQPYAAEPRKYRVTATRLTCLNLWGLDISTNSAGLVEVYLGDIGEKLPSDEWGHWKSHNVTPDGEMDEGRYRRDFLGQSASSHDPVRELQRARGTAVDVSREIYGTPIWKPLVGQARVEFEALIGPLNSDPSALGPPLLILTKTLVDAIDNQVLKTLVAAEKGDQSLRLLTRLAESLGDETDLVSILRNLQLFRSKGGIAHLAGSQRSSAEAALGITNLTPAQAFESVTTRVTACLNGYVELMRTAASDPSHE